MGEPSSGVRCMDDGGGGRAERPVGVSSEGGGCSSTTGGSDACVWGSQLQQHWGTHERSDLAVLRDEDQYPIIKGLDEEFSLDSRDGAAQLEGLDGVLSLGGAGRGHLVRFLKECGHAGGWCGVHFRSKTARSVISEFRFRT